MISRRVRRAYARKASRGWLDGPSPLAPHDLFGELCVRTARVRRRFIRGGEHLTQFALAAARDVEESVGEFDRVLLRRRFQNREAGNQLLRFGEWAIGHDGLPVGASNTRPFCAREATLGRDQPAIFHALLDELLHAGHMLQGWRLVGFFGFVDRQKSHVTSPYLGWPTPIWRKRSSRRRTRAGAFDKTRAGFQWTAPAVSSPSTPVTSSMRRTCGPRRAISIAPPAAADAL